MRSCFVAALDQFCDMASDRLEAVVVVPATRLRFWLGFVFYQHGFGFVGFGLGLGFFMLQS